MIQATPTSLAGLVGTWHLDPKNTTVTFHTTAMWGLAKVTGTISTVHGSGAVGDDGVASGELVLDAASIDTRLKRRDKHLRGRDFFDVATYHSFTFTASEATVLPDGAVGIKGSLRIKDRSCPLDLVATLTMQTPERIALSAEAVIDRREWGVSRAPMGAGFANRVVVVTQFVRL